MGCRAFLVAALLFAAAPVAQAGSGVGLRTGVTDDVDSAFLGAHLRFAAERLRGLRLEPSFDVGFGDVPDVVLAVAYTFDL